MENNQQIYKIKNVLIYFRVIFISFILDVGLIDLINMEHNGQDDNLILNIEGEEGEAVENLEEFMEEANNPDIWLEFLDGPEFQGLMNDFENHQRGLETRSTSRSPPNSRGCFREKEKR